MIFFLFMNSKHVLSVCFQNSNPVSYNRTSAVNWCQKTRNMRSLVYTAFSNSADDGDKMRHRLRLLLLNDRYLTMNNLALAGAFCTCKVIVNLLFRREHGHGHPMLGAETQLSPVVTLSKGTTLPLVCQRHKGFRCSDSKRSK